MAEFRATAMVAARARARARTSAIRSALVAWYDVHARPLPWRRTRDPYRIWVSEVMLQQTRVETVVPYYERFLARFPDVTALAHASEDEVLALWSGLGYYRRARLLYAGAREVVARHDGRVPRDAEARRALPGIGRYTAGAIGSIAFDRAEAIVDGNVARVLARATCIETVLGARETERRLWERAAALVAGDRPGALNQALMELGATVCTPVAPRCDACPIAHLCLARARGREGELPRARARRPPRPVTVTGVLAFDRQTSARLWLVRTSGRLFGGLWGVPLAEGSGRACALAALSAAGVRGRLARAPLGSVVHVLTHRRMTVELWRATCARADTNDARRLVAPHELETLELGVSALTRKLLALAAS